MRRCRGFARVTAVQVEREFLAFPTVEAPGCLVEDAEAPVRTLIDTATLLPPRNVLALIVDAGARVLHTLRPWRTVRALAPGRVAVGVRE
jgi:hypothetical protein